MLIQRKCHNSVVLQQLQQYKGVYRATRYMMLHDQTKFSKYIQMYMTILIQNTKSCNCLYVTKKQAPPTVTKASLLEGCKQLTMPRLHPIHDSSLDLQLLADDLQVAGQCLVTKLHALLFYNCIELRSMIRFVSSNSINPGMVYTQLPSKSIPPVLAASYYGINEIIQLRFIRSCRRSSNTPRNTNSISNIRLQLAVFPLADAVCMQLVIVTSLHKQNVNNKNTLSFKVDI